MLPRGIYFKIVVILQNQGSVNPNMNLRRVEAHWTWKVDLNQMQFYP